jgi:tetratricopeptide (TPR) repeat protein
MLRADEAVADYEKSLELEPSSVRGRFFLGWQLYEMEKFEESIEHLQKGECATVLLPKIYQGKL